MRPMEQIITEHFLSNFGLFTWSILYLDTLSNHEPSLIETFQLQPLASELKKHPREMRDLSISLAHGGPRRRLETNFIENQNKPFIPL